MFNETQKLKIKRISTDQFLPCGTQTVHILHGPGRDLSFSRRSSVRSLLQRRELNPERKQGARKEGKKRKEKKSRKEGKVEECAAPLPLRCVAFKPFIRALQGRFSRLHRRNLEPPHVPLFLLSFHSSPPTSPPPPFDGGRVHHCPFGFKRARYGLVIVSLARAQLLQLGVSTGGRVI